MHSTLHPYSVYPEWSPMDPKIYCKPQNNIGEEKISFITKQNILRATFYPQEIKSYMDNIHASMTNSMLGL